MRPWLAAAVLLATALPPALAQSDAATTVTAIDSGGEPSYHFSPTTLTVGLAAEISVVGGTNEPHTLTHDAPVNERLFDTGQVSVGQTKLIRAPNAPGSYPFHCLYHPGMTGTLTVAATSTTTPTGENAPTGVPAPSAALAALALAGGALLWARAGLGRRGA